MFNPYFSSMKLGLISAMHGRSELTAMWAEHTSQFGIPVYAAITDGDYDNLETAWKYKFEWKVMPNNPGGPINSTTTLVLYIYTKAFSNMQLGYASAISVVLMVIILVITLIQFRVLRSRWEY